MLCPLIFVVVNMLKKRRKGWNGVRKRENSKQRQKHVRPLLVNVKNTENEG